MEIKTPEAQRPPSTGTEGGIHRRLQASLENQPDIAIDQVETAIPDEPARTELLKVSLEPMWTQQTPRYLARAAGHRKS